MNVLGKLFILGSGVGVEICEGQAFHLGHKVLLANAVQNGELKVWFWESTTNRDQAYATRISSVSNELLRRRQDVEALSRSISALRDRIEGGDAGTEEVDELVCIVGMHKHHKQRIEELVTLLEEVKYEYTEKKVSKAVTLRPGVGSDISVLLPNFSHPVLWCPSHQVKVEVGEMNVITREGIGAPADFALRNLPEFVTEEVAPGLVLTNDNHVVTRHGHGNNTGNTSILGTRTVCVGNTYSYTVQTDNSKNTNNYVMVGWAPSTLKPTGTTQYTSCGFYLYADHGVLYSQAGNYASVFAKAQGSMSVVTTSLDEMARTLSFGVNGEPEKVAFTNVPLGMQPAFCLFGNNPRVEFLAQ